MSWLRYLSIWSAKKLNPDWSIRLYIHNCEDEYSNSPWEGEVKQDFFNYEGDDFLKALEEIDVDVRVWEPKFFNNSLSGIAEAMRMKSPLVPKGSTPSHRSNYFKWHLMATEGGFYSDNDILFIKPFDNFYNKFADKDMLICYDVSELCFSIGLLGSKGNSEPYRDFYVQALKSFTSDSYQSAGVNALNLSLGNHSLSGGWDLLISKYPLADIANMGMEWVYPYDSNNVEFYFEKDYKYIDPKKIQSAIGLHWYAGHPIAQDWNNKLNANNYLDYDFLIPREISKLMGSSNPSVESIKRLELNL